MVKNKMNPQETETARLDVIDILEKNPKEAIVVLKALKEGRVEGNTYFGECSCLLGTIGRAKGIVLEAFTFDASLKNFLNTRNQLGEIIGRPPNPGSPAERWFGWIHEGDTPEDNEYSFLAHKWIEEWAGEKGLLK